MCTHHSHGLGVEHLLGGEGGEIGQVGQNIHSCHNGQRDDDGTRKISEEDHRSSMSLLQTVFIFVIKELKSRVKRSLVRLDHLLCDEIQVVPVSRKVQV